MSKFEVGDKVWSPLWGWGKYAHHSVGSVYPVKVQFETGHTVDYTADGKLYHSDRFPTLFYDIVKPEDWPNPVKPEREFKVGEPVIAYLLSGQYRRYFSGYDSQHRPTVYTDGTDEWTGKGVVQTHIRQLTEEEMAEYRKSKGLDK